MKLIFTPLLIATCSLNLWACADFYKKIPNIPEHWCVNHILTPSGAHSVQGRPLWIGDVSDTAPQLRVLVMAAMHGDEFSSASVALHWMAMAQAQPQFTHWRFVPVVNPDGMLHRPARRMNAHGVDLNRNFPTPNWQSETKHYWEKLTHKDPRRWPGTAPLSEPESQFIFNQISSFKPDVIVSIHAPYGVLDFDGPVLPPTKLGRLHLNQVGVFPGSLGNYAGVQSAVPVVTVELPSALHAPSTADMRKMWLDLRHWMNQTVLVRR